MTVKDLAYTSAPIDDAMQARFVGLTYCDPNTGCFLWTGVLDKNGYARFSVNRTVNPAMKSGHRIAWQIAHGYAPPRTDDEGNLLTLDHLCRVRHCVNVEHLELVTNRENILRGEGFAAKHATLTHCLRGHPFDEENTYIPARGGRECRACRRETIRKRHATAMATTPRRKSRFRGVSWHRSARKWIAQMQFAGERIYLGSFDDEEEAARAYADKKQELENGPVRGNARAVDANPQLKE